MMALLIKHDDFEPRHTTSHDLAFNKVRKSLLRYALNFGLLFISLDVLIPHGGFMGDVGTLLMPTNLPARMLASSNHSALPSARYEQCPHPFAPIRTLAACEAAAKDVLANVQDDFSDLKHFNRSDWFVVTC